MVSDLVDLRLMISLLVIFAPNDFHIQDGTIKDLMEADHDEQQLFDEVLYQIKEYFQSRNYEGKSLFRVLIKSSTD